MASSLSNEALDQLFRQARSHNGWKPGKVTDEQVHALYDLVKMGPTSANACPARFVFIRSDEQKAKLKPCMAPGNVDKTMSAPLVVIVGMDMQFYELLPKLFPHDDARSWYLGNEDKIFDAAFRNSSLQGAYLIMAARSLGLDCGPMSGFDAQKVEDSFFPDSNIKVNFICAIGEGDSSKLFERHPRLDFDEACQLI